MPSSFFSRTSPLGAGAFHLALPQAMLEPQVLQDVLTQRCTGAYGETWMSWSTGSLLVLLSKYLLEEEHVASRYWTRLAGWLQQQHHLFFSSCCCLRVLLAFELLNEYYVMRPDDKCLEGLIESPACQGTSALRRSFPSSPRHSSYFISFHFYEFLKATKFSSLRCAPAPRTSLQSWTCARTIAKGNSSR